MADSNKLAAAEKKALELRSAVLEDFFEDFYRLRRRIYVMNFIRGVWFGVGTFIGGTLVLAALLWFLSLAERIPFMTEIVRTLQITIEEARTR